METTETPTESSKTIGEGKATSGGCEYPDTGRDKLGRYTETNHAQLKHGGAGLMLRVQDNKPWPAQAQAELAQAQRDLSTPTGRRSIKHASVAQIKVICDHYFDGWLSALARNDDAAAGAALKVYGWLVGHLLRGLEALDKSDKAPGTSAADVLDAIRSNDDGSKDV